MSDNYTPTTVDEIVDQVIDDLSLEEKVKVANLGNDDISIINALMTDYIQSKLNEWSIQQDETDLTEPEAIVKEIWKRLRETHKLRVIRR